MVVVEVATEGVVVGMMAVVWEEEEGEVETRVRWKLVLETGTVHRKLSFFLSFQNMEVKIFLSPKIAR